MTNSIAPMYAVSCVSAIGSSRPIRRRVPVQASAARATHTNVTKNWLEMAGEQFAAQPVAQSGADERAIMS